MPVFRDASPGLNIMLETILTMPHPPLGDSTGRRTCTTRSRKAEVRTRRRSGLTRPRSSAHPPSSNISHPTTALCAAHLPQTAAPPGPDPVATSSYRPWSVHVSTGGGNFARPSAIRPDRSRPLSCILSLHRGVASRPHAHTHTHAQQRARAPPSFASATASPACTTDGRRDNRGGGTRAESNIFASSWNSESRSGHPTVLRGRSHSIFAGLGGRVGARAGITIHPGSELGRDQTDRSWASSVRVPDWFVWAAPRDPGIVVSGAQDWRVRQGVARGKKAYRIMFVCTGDRITAIYSMSRSMSSRAGVVWGVMDTRANIH
ncbi:hypothetical protein L226DRAFT_179863 [Lentinus tigrinus ALCF2SS1-7]|uniref:Uncharacterized protein n=1 Tax=Lentinus tigrinus ALCF2SS1-6 TaxID=1328759 RepID=A0A5C2SRW1_9APHY|nr:hypothetical protein L227DRAFT_121718 [Lentinus tigrinus ALCF2SS1-6]RPD79757.1 hypothetical protein L226DRAFT_179863 [Lentinus tigrinus ALCF2SS1-7]